MKKSDDDFLRDMAEELKAAIEIDFLQEENKRLYKKMKDFAGEYADDKDKDDDY